VISNPLRRWLSTRIRILCVLAFVVGGFLPPYMPKDAFANGGGIEDDISVDAPQFLLVEDGFLMKSSSLTQQGARRAYAEGIVHTVRDGDNLQKIADRYRISIDTILWANGITRDAPLKPGQDLVILPVDGVLHTVGRGQTIQQIAELYNVPASAIASQNGVQGNFILAGQELIIPGGRPILGGDRIAQGGSLTFNPNVKPGAINSGYTGRPPSPPKTNAKPTGATAEPSYGVLGMPCANCYYTQYYHPGHYAVDIQTRGGGPIFAAEEGVVIRADTGWNGGYGNVIEIDHGNGLVTLYGHNKALFVKKGDKVTRGQEIAAMGNTGQVYGKTGIHTHFEVRVNGVKKNPLLYLK
jgi:murein DD-endopeptidase MepM/ murein hydrolase activator NlpD